MSCPIPTKRINGRIQVNRKFSSGDACVFHVLTFQQVIQVDTRNLAGFVGNIPRCVFIVIFQRINDLIVRRHIHFIDIIFLQLIAELVKPHLLRPIHHRWKEENI